MLRDRRPHQNPAIDEFVSRALGRISSSMLDDRDGPDLDCILPDVLIDGMADLVSREPSAIEPRTQREIILELTDEVRNRSGIGLPVCGSTGSSYMLWRNLIGLQYVAQRISQNRRVDGMIPSIRWHEFRNAHQDLVRTYKTMALSDRMLRSPEARCCFGVAFDRIATIANLPTNIRQTLVLPAMAPTFGMATEEGTLAMHDAIRAIRQAAADGMQAGELIDLTKKKIELLFHYPTQDGARANHLMDAVKDVIPVRDYGMYTFCGNVIVTSLMDDARDLASQSGDIDLVREFIRKGIADITILHGEVSDSAVSVCIEDEQRRIEEDILNQTPSP